MFPLFKRQASRPGLFDAAILGAAVALLGLQMEHFADDPGLGGHLSTGRLLFEQGGLPAHDPFMAVDPPPLWVPDQWLAVFVIYLLYLIGSWPLLFALGVSIYLLGFFGVLSRAISGSGAFPLARLVAVLVAFKLSLIHFVARPLLVNYILFPLTLLVCYRLAGSERDSRPITKVTLCGVPLYFALWVNLHGAFALGLVTLGCAALSLLIEWGHALIRGDSERQQSVFRYFLRAGGLTAAASAATLLNPWGWEIHRTILSYMFGKSTKSLLDEWHPLDFASDEGSLFLVLVAVLTVAAVIGYIKGRRAMTSRPEHTQIVSPFELLLLLFLGWSTIGSIRQLPFFAMAAARPLAVALTLIAQEFLRLAPDATRLVRRTFGRVNQWTAQSEGTATLTLVTILLPLYSLAAGNLPLVPQPVGPRPERIPAAAITALRSWVDSPPPELAAIFPAGRPLVVVAHPNWGGALTFYGEGLLRPIIDDRDRMLGLDYYEEFFAELNSSDRWLEYLRRKNADLVLVGPADKLNAKLAESPAARRIYEDPYTVGYLLLPARNPEHR